MASKLDEAEDLIKKAQKSLKTSFLKWKPDIDSAVEYYKQAAIIYKNQKHLRESAEIYSDIGKLLVENGSYFHAAKSYESSAMLYRDLNDFHKMADTIEIAGKTLRENGIPDTATSVYEKAAGALENYLPEKSAEFYYKSAESCEFEEKYLEAADFANLAARVWVKMRKFAESERTLRYQIEMCVSAASTEPQLAIQLCGKAVVALCIVKLFEGDSIAASKIHQEALNKWNFGETDDALPLQRLIQSYESLDSELSEQVLKSPTFRNLETEYSRLARAIKFPTTEHPHTDLPVSGVNASSVDVEDDIC